MFDPTIMLMSDRIASLRNTVTLFSFRRPCLFVRHRHGSQLPFFCSRKSRHALADRESDA